MRLVALLLALFIAAPASAQVFGPAVFVPTVSAPPGNTCSTPGPIDLTANAVAAAYGSRVLRDAYAASHAYNVDVSSTPIDIGFSGCDLDTSSLSSCTAPGNCPINTVYDQSGKGVNLPQTGTARPSLVLNRQNGHATIVTTGSQCLANGTLSTGVYASTTLAAAKLASLSSGQFPVLFQTSPGGNNDIALYWNGTNNQLIGERKVSGTSANALDGSPPIGVFFQTIFTANATLGRLAVNATYFADDTATVSSPAQTVFALLSCSNPMPGDLGEFILFAPDISKADGDTIAANQKAYWGTP